MYCANCGVKLSDTEKQCPLCGVKAYHPDIQRAEGEYLYPPNRYPRPGARSYGIQIVATAAFLLPIIIVLLCDLQTNNRLTWAGYVIGALILNYELFILPIWFKKPNPVIFVPCAFVAIGLYLLYINYATGGNWFLSFAFPVVGYICLIVTAVVTLARYVKKGYLYIFGGAFIALGIFMPLMEFLLNITFHIAHYVSWSFYPLTALVLLGGVLIFLAICAPARETMERKFFF